MLANGVQSSLARTMMEVRGDQQSQKGGKTTIERNTEFDVNDFYRKEYIEQRMNGSIDLSERPD